MAVQLRIKGTTKLLHMNSGKYMWSQAAHAKASVRTSGISHTSMRDLKEAFPDEAILKEQRGWRERFKFTEIAHLIEIVDLVEEDKLGKQKIKTMLLKLAVALEETDKENIYPDYVADAYVMMKELSNG